MGVSRLSNLPPLSARELALRDALRRHVDALAGLIGERSVRRPSSLEAAAQYIRRCWEEQNLQVQTHEYTVRSDAWPTQVVQNLVVELPGSANANEIILIGAHYDTVRNCPGANDNATSVGGILEMPRLLAALKLHRTIRFVAFVNEEPPFFHTPVMGSRVYARHCRQRQDRIVGMLALDTIGCYTDEKGSQKYPLRLPFPLNLLFTTRGNFVMFVSDWSSRGFMRRCRKLFERHAQFPCRSFWAPQRIPGIGWSDHWSFWQEGYPAILVTDSAPYRYKHYHRDTDTPEKVDYDNTARVVAGLAALVAHLATA